MNLKVKKIKVTKSHVPLKWGKWAWNLGFQYQSPLFFHLSSLLSKKITSSNFPFSTFLLIPRWWYLEIVCVSVCACVCVVAVESSLIPGDLTLIQFFLLLIVHLGLFFFFLFQFSKIVPRKTYWISLVQFLWCIRVSAEAEKLWEFSKITV